MKRECGGTQHSWCVLLFALLAGALVGCAAPRATSQTNEVSFDQAVTEAVDGLVTQTQKLPTFLTKVETKVESKLAKRSVVLDPMIDATSGQQTGITRLLEQSVTSRLSTYDQFDLLAFSGPDLGKAQYLLTGTTTTLPARGSSHSLRIDLALTELKTGTVVAQASAVARNEGLDSSPTAYYRDSPVLVKDKFIDGYVRTSATAPGQPGDPDYLGAVGVATLINAAGTLYDAENYKESLQRYSEAAESPAGQQLRVLIGLYLTNSKLGNTPAAEQAFAKVVALGISNNILDVKLLFNPGSTEFWSDTKVSGVYPMWLRQIARGAVADKVCMQIVGHTSHTGSEQLNDALSLQRAAYIRQRLELESPTLSGRLDTIGKGYHENIVGSGTDDARDALDRRVEFKIVPCK